MLAFGNASFLRTYTDCQTFLLSLFKMFDSAMSIAAAEHL